jgi:hypothetical protein
MDKLTILIQKMTLSIRRSREILRDRHRNNNSGNWYKLRSEPEMLVLFKLSTPIHSNRQNMTASFNVVRSGGDESSLNEVPPTAPVSIVDLREALEWLPAESERIAQQKELDREAKERAIRGEVSAHFYDTLEQGLYWLICAVALACLVLGMLGL